jgi:hypothetical protein
LAAGIGAFAASFCYAKFAPAALLRSKFGQNRCKDGEALGYNPKFELSQSWRVIAGSAERSRKALFGTKLCKACPRLEPFKQANGARIA